jgi:hypothetical protein
MHSQVFPDTLNLIEFQVGGEEAESSPGSKRKVLLEGARLKGWRAREFYSQQLMLPEWMVDIPLHLKKDWYSSQHTCLSAAVMSSISLEMEF